MVASLTLSILLGIGIALLASLALAGRLPLALPPAAARAGAVDGLRGVAALTVMAHHFILSIGADRLGIGWHAWLPLFESLGSGGVGLFFMTTGFVFQPTAARGLRQDWSAVFVGRVMRLYPLAILSILLCAAAALAMGGNTDAPAGVATWLGFWRQPALFGYEDAWRLNAGVLWSLWFEVAFYLSLPLLAGVATLLGRLGIPFRVLPLAALVAAATGRQAAPDVLSFGVAQLFAVGMLARDAAADSRLAAALRRPAVTVAAALGLVLAATLYDGPYDPVPLALYGAFFACVAAGNGFGVLHARGPRVLGTVSYGIYLLHGLVLAAAFVGAAPLVAAVPTAALPALLPVLMAVTVLAAAASWHLVEAPAIRLGKRIAGGRRRARGGILPA